ncbi:hypothetical protein [Xanthomonas floridensis]|uniref:Uncharacterized protein n=1 Tax=Xanthomonas floridensis TaxID=1843580 RepID=A0ABU5PW60_9XANT|nr:hypothetical protein [Xanthomonas floridensis]MEA5123843.1 hypothetical protein [Xanthomonas floridensis]MEA5131522.1 hypothetical protein [Xanthomonas floridensis]
MPIGAHVAARVGEQSTLLALAAQLERAQPWAVRSPPLNASAVAAAGALVALRMLRQRIAWKDAASINGAERLAPLPAACWRAAIATVRIQCRLGRTCYAIDVPAERFRCHDEIMPQQDHAATLSRRERRDSLRRDCSHRLSASPAAAMLARCRE